MLGSWLFLLLVLLVAALVVVVRKVKLRPGGATFGTAAFGPWPGAVATRLAELAPGLVLGRTEAGELAGWAGEGHWLLFAPTGAGKSTGVLMPSLLSWRASMVAIDVKGELARACAPRLREQGIACVRLDPFGLLDASDAIPKVRLHPVELAARSADPAASWRKLANMIVEPAEGGGAHWADSARMVLASMLAAASAATRRDRVGLRGVLALAGGGKDAMRSMLGRSWPPALEPLVASGAKVIIDAGANERGAILSTLRRQLDFLASPGAMEAIGGTWEQDGHWQPQALLEPDRPVALFVILPAERLSTHARLLRVAIGCVVEQLLAAGPSASRRLLLALDEAAALGPLEAVTEGVGLFRGYGARMLLAFQDEGQLQATYGPNLAASIHANCHSLYWGMRDLATCERVAALLGERTVLASSRELGKLPLEGAGATGKREVARKLLNPDELRRLPADAMIALAGGEAPARLRLLAPNERL